MSSGFAPWRSVPTSIPTRPYEPKPKRDCSGGWICCQGESMISFFGGSLSGGAPCGGAGKGDSFAFSAAAVLDLPSPLRVRGFTGSNSQPQALHFESSQLTGRRQFGQ